ncbi:MAG: hypothetical protein M3Z64_04395 [Verrucomicrobiota bacterium]|nr:hypothetical protein [Verrucomicrobiota bacterium]
MAAASLRALLAGSIDYAGLFPPAELDLEPALKNYAEYVRTADVWMLGAFVLPLAKLEAAAANLAPFDVEHRLRIAALGGKTESAAEFLKVVASAAESIAAFNKANGATASVDQLEMPVAAGVDADSLAEASAALSALKLAAFVEAHTDEAERTIALLAEQREAGSGVNVGFKLRTGGVIASAFPSSVQIARALVAAVQHKVPIKFTAGLHHPIRGFRQSVQTKMHGFLNVLGAGLLAGEHEWDVQQTAAMLEDESPDSFVFDDDTFTWRDWSITTDQITARRAFVTSLGSCSFDEPREDLHAFRLL